MRLELAIKQEEAAKWGRNGRHEAEADKAEQVATVVVVETSLSV